MAESFYTVLILGLLAGVIFSMPIAGPISIIITSNALKGRQQFCTRAAIGASLVEFLYVFIVVFGITKLYVYYKNYIPYILLVGSVFIFAVAWSILKTKLDLNDFDNSPKYHNKKQENKKGLQVGIITNLTNPTLLFGWLTSSFMVLSMASSIGLNTGGLDILVGSNVSVLTGELTNTASNLKNNSNLVLSAIYAVGVAIGCAIWFIFLSQTIIKHRSKLDIKSLNIIIKTLGACLFAIGFYLVWQAITSLT